MYALAGTSICQHKSSLVQRKIAEIDDSGEERVDEDGLDDDDLLILADSKESLLARISPIYNGRMSLVKKAKDYYKHI